MNRGLVRPTTAKLEDLGEIEDENERLIAQLMREDADAMGAQNNMAGMGMGMGADPVQ